MVSVQEKNPKPFTHYTILPSGTRVITVTGEPIIINTAPQPKAAVNASDLTSSQQEIVFEENTAPPETTLEPA